MCPLVPGRQTGNVQSQLPNGRALSSSWVNKLLSRRMLRMLPAVGSFFLGFLITSVLSVFFIPVVEEVAEFRDDLFCPNTWWCSSHLEFKSTKDAQCSIGSIGTLISQAISDGNLANAEVHELQGSFASRAFLCDDVVWSMNSATMHLKRLDYNYGDCFIYEANKLTVSESEEGREFKVNLGKDSEACISNIWKNPMTGMLDTTNIIDKAFVFCIPNDNTTRRVFSEKAKLPVCTNQDLRSVGFPESLLPN